MEKHFGSKEALVTYIDRDLLTNLSHHGEGLKLSRLLPLSSRVLGLLVELSKFFDGIFADVAVGFFHGSTDFLETTSDHFSSFLECVHDVLRNVLSSKGKGLDATSNNGTVANWEDCSCTFS